MPWPTHGLSNGILTTDWPRRQDKYFDSFLAAIDVTTGHPDIVQAQDAAAQCPTNAITATDGAVRLDRGRCILCGRCAAIAPDVFIARRGADVATQLRSQLVVGDIEETGDSLLQVREALASRVKYLRRSVHIRHVDTGSDGADEWEVQALLNPVYDIHRLGIFFTASPRHADILLATGGGVRGMREPLERTREAMPDPVVVISVGSDAAGGGIIAGGYANAEGIGPLLNVDVWVPGSPASPFSILHGILLALDRLPTKVARSQ